MRVRRDGAAGPGESGTAPAYDPVAAEVRARVLLKGRLFVLGALFYDGSGRFVGEQLASGPGARDWLTAGAQLLAAARAHGASRLVFCRSTPSRDLTDNTVQLAFVGALIEGAVRAELRVSDFLFVGAEGGYVSVAANRELAMSILLFEVFRQEADRLQRPALLSQVRRLSEANGGSVPTLEEMFGAL